MAKAQEYPAGVAPDQLTVNPIQAERLASLTRLDAKGFVGAKLGEIAEKLKWHLDPHLFLFRRICGRVVKKDPATGVEYGVPNATVQVQDTDCRLIAYFPVGSKYSWLYPFGCRRETLATVKTDACGNFCVWIPRWDIDWILSWRKRRFCFPLLFERPRIWDILADLLPKVEVPRPRPGPDPAPDVDPTPILEGLRRFSASQLTNLLGSRVGERVHALARQSAFGSSLDDAQAVLGENALGGLLPPLPEEFKQVDLSPDAESRKGHSMALVRSTLSQRLGIDAGRLEGFDLRYPIGPFRRCVTYYVPEWTVIYDVPDITFRVTQDVDGDGNEEVIYSEGYFDVRWDAGYIPPVTLVASAIARESRVCEVPPVVCGNVPDIQFAGMMPLKPAYHDNVTGYALRPNRPKLPPPAARPAATAPFCQNVNLFGCLVKTGGATKYRIVYRYSSDGGSTFSPDAAFTNVDWWWHPLVGSPVHAVPDVDGWYAMPPAGLVGPEVNFLFPFDTGANANGLYAVRVQVGTGGSSVTAESTPIRLRTDNSAPDYSWDVFWRVVGTSAWTRLEYPCPLVRRGVTAQAVEFDVRWAVSASHYRDSSIGAGDCGDGSFGAPTTLAGSTASDPPSSDWHTGPLDNSVVFHARYELPASAAQGTYSFGLNANSRAFNPAGADPGYQANDWFHDAVHVWVSPTLLFSVVDANL